MKKQTPSRYRTYLLRCWQEGTASDQPWRFSLEGVQDSQRFGFANLESLLVFLQEITCPENGFDETGGSSQECLPNE